MYDIVTNDVGGPTKWLSIIILQMHFILSESHLGIWQAS